MSETSLFFLIVRIIVNFIAVSSYNRKYFFYFLKKIKISQTILLCLLINVQHRYLNLQ